MSCQRDVPKSCQLTPALCPRRASIPDINILIDFITGAPNRPGSQLSPEVQQVFEPRMSQAARMPERLRPVPGLGQFPPPRFAQLDRTPDANRLA
jgi:hypothetical protein